MKKLAWVLGVVAFYALSACALVQPSGTYRYKLTVYVDTPEGVKSGYAVREITAHDNTGIVVPGIGRAGCGFRAEGEAVVVDLGERGVVFAVLTQAGGSTDHIWQIVHETFPLPDTMEGICLKEGIKYYTSLKAKGEVALQDMPMMVTFADMKDPTSVQLVYQAQRCERRSEKGPLERYGCVKADNFEKIFGRGVKLNRVEIEMTDEPVTDEVEGWLPWLDDLNGKYLHNGLTAKNAPLGLHTGNFKEKYNGF